MPPSSCATLILVGGTGDGRRIIVTMRRSSGVLALLLAGCPSSGPAAVETSTSSSTDSWTTTSTGTSSEIETGTETSSDSETSSDTETAEPCTGEVCDSSLTLTFGHSLPLLDGPYRFLITLPIHDLICSVEPSLSGHKSCFGWAFTDLSWTESQVTVVLLNPFYDTELNPSAEPFASAMVRVERGVDLVWASEVPIVAGDPLQPDPCGPVCWQATGAATLTD